MQGHGTGMLKKESNNHYKTTDKRIRPIPFASCWISGRTISGMSVRLEGLVSVNENKQNRSKSHGVIILRTGRGTQHNCSSFVWPNSFCLGTMSDQTYLT